MAAAAVAVAAQVAAKLLGQHTARLAGAKNENAAIPQVVAAFDADYAAIISAYNSGAANAATCLAALQAVDSGITAYLKKQVGPAGTSWNSTTGFAGKCDKTCTAGCCVYYGDLGPPLSLAALAISGKPMYSQWGSSDPRISVSAGGTVIQVPKVFASKYGGQDRAGYTVNIVMRAAAAANPPQYAQAPVKGAPALPVPTRTGLVSEGTPTGSTSTFSSISSNGLATAAGLATQQVAATSAGTPMTNTEKMLIGAGAVILLLAGILALKS